MPVFEYKVVPAPVKGKKAKGVRGTDARFALALQEVMNQMGAEGWEYQRAETLPCEERHGLTSVTTSYRNMLVFRRPAQAAEQTTAPKQLPAPSPEEQTESPNTPSDFFLESQDNGVEDAEDMGSPDASPLIERAARLKAGSSTLQDDQTEPAQDKSA
ncbi:DUF4177 domain-containing protein [Thalassovita sp.]|jgi:hypothetical protein|uniref:DUF4177 domain-containing protein n=1 Tax=Thalassovita sp. TaxID=1979401 RepID=UPI003B5B764C